MSGGDESKFARAWEKMEAALWLVVGGFGEGCLPRTCNFRPRRECEPLVLLRTSRAPRACAMSVYVCCMYVCYMYVCYMYVCYMYVCMHCLPAPPTCTAYLPVQAGNPTHSRANASQRAQGSYGTFTASASVLLLPEIGRAHV